MPGASKVSRIVLAALAALLAGVIRLPGADPAWLKLTSPNFEVYTSAGKGTGRDAIRHFEQIHQFFQELTSVKPDTSNRVRIIIFRTDKEYEPYKPNEFAAAFYMGTNDRDYIVIGGESKNNRQAAIHEYVHLLVKHSGAPLPPWLNEGFAELYSTLTPFAGKIKIGDLIPGRLQVLQQNKWLDLETLTAVDHDSVHYNERDRAGVFYSQSWALTHMLALSKPYHQGFRDFLLNIARGGNAESAFRQVYGMSLDEADKDLKTYASGGNTFYAAFYDLKLAKLAEEPAVAEASSFEVNLILANMLSQSRGKADAAQLMLEELGKENPESWEVAETRGYLDLRQRRNDEARMHFSKAVALGSSNPQLFYDLARLTSRDVDSSDAVRDLLERAVELRKDFNDARTMLAFEYMRRKEYVNCLRHFAMLRKLDPESAFSVYHTAAHAYLQIDRPDDARSHAI
jgi:tetratricopeptide (TPR) repeat protein